MRSAFLLEITKIVYSSPRLSSNLYCHYGLHEHLDFSFALKGYSKVITFLSEVTPMAKLAPKTPFISLSNK